MRETLIVEGQPYSRFLMAYCAYESQLEERLEMVNKDYHGLFKNILTQFMEIKKKALLIKRRTSEMASEKASREEAERLQLRYFFPCAME